MAWVNAALGTDLSSFSLYTHKSQSLPSSTTPPQVVVVLDTTTKATAPSSKGKQRAPATSTKAGKHQPATAMVSPSARRWEKGGGLEDGVELGKELEEESKNRFVGFMERFLDAKVGGASARLPWDRDLVVGMLSHLKKVNDWLDCIRKQDGMGEGDGSRSMAGGLPPEIVERVRKKIYNYLLTHVVCAATALSGGGLGGPTTLSAAREQKERKS